MNNFRKNFTKIFAGQTISLLTSAIVQYAIVWYLSFTTGSAIILSIAMIVATLPQILLGPFAGVIVDRFDRKKIMILSDSFIAIATLILAALFLMGTVPNTAIYIVLAIRSIGATFHTPSFQASIPLLAPEDKIVKIAGINQTITSITNIIAPLLAGVLYGIWKIEFIIMLDMIGAIFGVLSIASVKIPKLEKKEEKIEVIKEMKEGMQEISKSKFVLIMTIYATIISIIFMPVGTLFPLITSNYFHLEPIHASIVETLFSVGMLVGGVLLATWGGFKKKQYTAIVSIAGFGICIAVAGMLPVNAFTIFVILSGIMGIATPLFNGTLIAMIQLKIEPEKLGRVFSIITSLMLVATPVGLLFSAPIAEKIGINIWFIISGILIMLVSIGVVGFKAVRQEEWKEEKKIEE